MFLVWRFCRNALLLVGMHYYYYYYYYYIHMSDRADLLLRGLSVTTVTHL